MKAKDTKRKTRTGAARRIGALFLALTMTFGTWTPAFAEEPVPVIEEHVETPAKETEKVTPEVQETPAQDKADGLDIGPEIVEDAVGESAIEAPTIDNVFYGDTSVSGKNLHRAKVDGKTVRATVHVTVTDKNGNEKANVSVTPKRGTSWTVKLPAGVEIAEGDKVTAYQELNGDQSPAATANAEPSLANQITLTMPTGEIWIEQTSSNIVNDEEQAEAQQMLRDANTGISNKIKDIKFSIDGTDHAYYEVTYTDGSTSGKIEAKGLKINTVTEHSATPTIQKVQVADKQIIVTLREEPAPGTKFYFIKEFTDGEEKTFCQNGNCTPEKTKTQEMAQGKVNVQGTTVTFQVTDDDLELKRMFGVIVKEPHKLRSCAKSEPVVTVPDKVAVRDPHKLTDDDKNAIDQAIRDANTVNGKSKMPNGTGFIDDPAFIEFDKDGNVTIISPNDVEVNWDSSGNPVYQKNPDGTYKVNAGATVYKIPAKDLVKNVKPKPPKIDVNINEGQVTITPPAYEKMGDDTDLVSYTLTYKDASGADKTVTATRDLKTNKWTGTGVNEETGVITLDVKDLEVGGTLTATAKDNGGLEGDTDKLDSDEASKTLETATVTYEPNGGSDNTEGKKVNKGSKYNLATNGFTAPKGKKFKAWKIGDTEYAEGAEITVKEDTTVEAVWVDDTVDITFDANGGTGSMDKQTVEKGSTFKLPDNGFTAPENKKFKGWKIGETEYKVGDEITVNGNTEVQAVWEDIMVKLTFDPNGGTWTEGGTANKEFKVKKGTEFTIIAAPTKSGNTFQYWKGSEYKPDQKYTAKEDHTFTAQWKANPTPPGGDDNPGTNPGGDNPGTQPNDPSNPNQPGDPNNPNKPNDPNAPGQSSDPKGPKGPKDPSAPWGKGNTDIDALLRRMKALRNDPAVRKILEGQRVIPKAGVGASTTAVESVLFPVDLLPAPKKREEE